MVGWLVMDRKNDDLGSFICLFTIKVRYFRLQLQKKKGGGGGVAIPRVNLC